VDFRHQLPRKGTGREISSIELLGLSDATIHWKVLEEQFLMVHTFSEIFSPDTLSLVNLLVILE
jgi:hypothetical protein